MVITEEIKVVKTELLPKGARIQVKGIVYEGTKEIKTMNG